MNKEFFEALDLLEKERHIPKSYMLEKIEAALTAACKKELGTTNITVVLDPEKMDMKVMIVDEDSHCPCGHVFGLAAKDGSMKLRRENLVEMHADVVGPCKKDFVVAYTSYRRKCENQDKLIGAFTSSPMWVCLPPLTPLPWIRHAWTLSTLRT